MAIDSSNNLWISGGVSGYYDLNMLRKLDTSGNILVDISRDFCNTYVNPEYISSDNQFHPGSTYVSDEDECVDPDGTGPLEIGDGQFEEIKSITMDNSGNLYVLDPKNFRVQKFDSNGNFLSKFGHKYDYNAYGAGGFRDGTSSITVDNSGFIYVMEGKLIKKFDSNGNLIETISDYPHCGSTQKDITIDSSGAIYVTGHKYKSQYDYADCVTSVLTKIDPSGNNFDITNLRNPINVALDQDEFVYVSDKDYPSINKYDSDGNLLNLITGRVGDEIGQIRFPYDVELDSVGNIYVLEYDNNRIQIFDPQGNPLEIIDLGTEGQGRIKFDSSGNIYVLNHARESIKIFDSEHNSVSVSYLTSGAGSGPSANPYYGGNLDSFDFDSSGNLYFIDNALDRIIKANSNLEFLGWLGDCYSGTNCNETTQLSNGFSCTGDTCVGLANPSPMFSSLTEISIDQNDNIYVANYNALSKLDLNGNVLFEIENIGNIRAMEVDNFGNIFIVGNFGIKKYDSNGNLIYHLDSSQYPDSFPRTTGIAISDSGTIYISDSLLETVQVFAP